MSTCHDLVDQQLPPTTTTTASSNFNSTITDFYSTTRMPSIQQQQHNHMYNNNNYQQQQQQYITKSGGGGSNCNNTNSTVNCTTSTITSFPSSQMYYNNQLSSTSTMINNHYNNNYTSNNNNNTTTNTTTTTTITNLSTTNHLQSNSQSCINNNINQSQLFNCNNQINNNNIINNNNNCNNNANINANNNNNNTIQQQQQVEEESKSNYNNNNKNNNNKQTVQNHSFDTPIDKYKVTEIIGSGTYGVVAICKELQTDQQFALKKNIRVFPDENDLNQSTNSTTNNGKYVAFNNSGKLHQLRMLRELKMLHHFRNCPYIVNLKDVYVPNQLNQLRDIEMITSLMEADLRDIFDSGQSLSPKHVKWFMYQICLSVYYMQKAKILHRDLKPENILVNSQCDVAICDFGLARGYYNSLQNKKQLSSSSPQSHIIDINNITNNNPLGTMMMNHSNHSNQNNGINNINNNNGNEEDDLSENQTKLSSNYVVSRWYRPPELLTNATQVYNKTLDMWSVGCIMYELLSGKGEVLFKGSGSIDQIQRIIKQLGTPAIDDFNGSEAARDYIYNKFPICKRRSFTKRLPPNTCPMAIDLMKRMLTFNMYKRINPLDALLHPYFREFYDQSDLNIPLSPFDTAWEENMLSSNDLKLEAFNTLKSIKKDHLIELQQLQQQQLLEQQQQQLDDYNQNDDYQDIELIDDHDIIMMNHGRSSSADQLQHHDSLEEEEEENAMLLSQSENTHSSTNNNEDFLMMVVDNYGKLSVDNHCQPLCNTNAMIQQQQQQQQQQYSSKKVMDHNFSPSKVVISYVSSNVYDSGF